MCQFLLHMVHFDILTINIHNNLVEIITTVGSTLNIKYKKGTVRKQRGTDERTEDRCEVHQEVKKKQKKEIK